MVFAWFASAQCTFVFNTKWGRTIHFVPFPLLMKHLVICKPQSLWLVFLVYILFENYRKPILIKLFDIYLPDSKLLELYAKIFFLLICTNFLTETWEYLSIDHYFNYIYIIMKYTLYIFCLFQMVGLKTVSAY